MASSPSATIWGHRQLGGGQGDAGIGGPDFGIGVGGRHRAQQLPTLGGPVGGVLSQQAVHDGGAGAGRADHEDGLVDGFIQGGWICVQVTGELDADFQKAQIMRRDIHRPIRLSPASCSSPRQNRVSGSMKAPSP